MAVDPEATAGPPAPFETELAKMAAKNAEILTIAPAAPSPRLAWMVVQADVARAVRETTEAEGDPAGHPQNRYELPDES